MTFRSRYSTVRQSLEATMAGNLDIAQQAGPCRGCPDAGRDEQGHHALTNSRSTMRQRGRAAGWSRRQGRTPEMPVRPTFACLKIRRNDPRPALAIQNGKTPCFWRGNRVRCCVPQDQGRAQVPFNRGAFDGDADRCFLFHSSRSGHPTRAAVAERNPAVSRPAADRALLHQRQANTHHADR